MTLYVIAFLFLIMFFVGRSLFDNGLKWNDEELMYSGKLLMTYCIIGFPLSLILYIATGA